MLLRLFVFFYVYLGGTGVLLFVGFFYLSLFVENSRQGGHNSPATLDLFLGFLEDAVHELKV